MLLRSQTMFSRSRFAKAKKLSDSIAKGGEDFILFLAHGGMLEGIFQ